MPAAKQDPSGPWRFAGIGVEFAASVGGLVLIGYWIDRHFQSSPKGVLIGAILGIVGGGYNLIRQALAAAKQAGESRATRRHGEDDSR